ncbi:MAG: sec-independent protein translocase protein TatA [Candidatus Frackibacter sp. T328-2]|nr:MAG: sec-independent protein translocase protein TatA [Candidatus Frackibacter sp. T328-2]
MFGLGPTELILILVIGLVIFGPSKLPDIGEAVGKGIKEFKSAAQGIEDIDSSKDED